MRRTLQICLSILLGITSAFGWQASEPAKTGIELAGTVTIRQTGLPAGDSIVTLQSASQKLTTRIDTKGRFQFSNVNLGSVRISVGRTREHLAGAVITTVRRERETTPIDLAVDRTCSVAGKIVGPDGEPARSVIVSVRNDGYAEGRLRLQGYHSARTDAAGEFRIANVLPGRYFLEAEPRPLNIPPAPGVLTKSGENGVIKTYFPGAPNQSGATQLILKTGEIRENVFLKLLAGKTACVQSKLTAPEGAHFVASVRVSERLLQTQSLLASGAVEIGNEVRVCGIPAGSYTLTAFGSDNQKESYFGTTGFEVVEGRDLTLPSLRLGRAREMTGTVRLEPKDGPDKQGNLSFLLKLQRLYGIGFPGDQLTAKISADGTFSIPAVFDDEYYLDISELPPKYYVVSARTGGRDAFIENIQHPIGELDVVLATDGPTLSGTVIDNNGNVPEDGIVALVADPLPTRFAPSQLVIRNVSQKGEFRFNNMPPGDYCVISVAGASDAEMRDLAFLLQYLPKGEKISLKANQASNISLRAVKP